MVHQNYTPKGKVNRHAVCEYCRKTPKWQFVGYEAICMHCGTRVFSSHISVIPTREMPIAQPHSR